MPDPLQRPRPDPQKNLVGFVVGTVHYAIDIAVVREIVNPLELTELPHMPSEVAGVADHRGDVVPVLDLRARFGLEPAAPTRLTKWILVDVGARTLGLVVDSVTEVFGTGGEEIRPTPEVGGDHERRGIVGVAKQSGKLTFVLDVGRFAEIVRRLEAQGALS